MASSLTKWFSNVMSAVEEKLEPDQTPIGTPDLGYKYLSRAATRKASTDLSKYHKKSANSYIPIAFFDNLLKGKIDMRCFELFLSLYNQGDLVYTENIKSVYWFDFDDYQLHTEPIKVPPGFSFDVVEIQLGGVIQNLFARIPICRLDMPETVKTTNGKEGSIAFPEDIMLKFFPDDA